MPPDPSSIDPLISQIPTSELKRVLIDRFAKDVVLEARQKIWRPMTIFGLPGIILGGTLAWGALDQSLTSRVAIRTAEIESRLGGVLSERTNTEVERKLHLAFSSQQGAVLQATLSQTIGTPEFRALLQKIAQEASQQALGQQMTALQGRFVDDILRNNEFLEQFARRVEAIMANGGSVERIIAGALEQSVKRARFDDEGLKASLPLLAAVNQRIANTVVREILGRRGEAQQREAALLSLDSVNFPGMTSDDGMLEEVLTLWAEYCSLVRCPAEHASTQAVAAFLRRGRDLTDAGRTAWIATLRKWHETIVAGDAPARAASLHLVPAALAAIGTPESVMTLTEWFSAPNSDLALTAATAVAALPSRTLHDAERFALFRQLWPKVMTPATSREALAEAGWMALGAVSRGRADAGGLYRAEAALIQLQSRNERPLSQLAAWASNRPNTLARLRGPSPLPQLSQTPCALPANTSAGSAEHHETNPRPHINLCGLVALIRPQNGEPEWNELRRVARWDQNEVATLGLLWAIAAVRTAGDAAPWERRLAPLPDLLLARVPSPAPFQLAAMAVLRTVPDRLALQALGAIRPSAGDARLFVVAAPLVLRGSADGHRLFSDQLLAMQEPVRLAILRELAGTALAIPETLSLPRAVDELVRRLAAPSPPVSPATFNTLRFIHAVAPEEALAAIERNDGFRSLQRIAEGVNRIVGADAATLHATLLTDSGWEGARGAQITPSPGRGAFLPLVPAHQGRFGRVRLQDRDIMTIDWEDPGKRNETLPAVTFFNPATHQVQVLRQGASWAIRSREAGDAEDWLFRLPDDAPAMRMRTIEPQRLVPAPTIPAPLVVTFSPGQIYQIDTLKQAQNDELLGYVRFDGLPPRQRIRISTFDLDDDVDTVVAVMRDLRPVAENDDDGEGWASALNWQVDDMGSVLVRLGNIRTDGMFRLRIERLGPEAEPVIIGRP